MCNCDDKSKAAIICTLLLLGVIAGGTCGFWIIEEDWGWWRSLYFTLITITTVGYGDEGISEPGRRYAVVLLLCGIGTFTYSLTTVVQYAVDREAALFRRMNRKIKETKDHIVVCGYGRMGRTVCDQLVEGGLTCIIIEPDECNYRRAVADGHLAVQGIASSDDTLLSAGIDRARGIVCAVDSDAENMFITISVRDLNLDCMIVSRAESESAARKLERAGACLVISPHQMAGQSIATAMLHPHLSHYLQMASDEDRLQLSETEIHPSSPFAGQTVQVVGRQADNVVFVAIRRQDGTTIMRPHGDEEFRAGDIVILAGRAHELQDLQTAACCEAISA